MRTYRPLLVKGKILLTDITSYRKHVLSDPSAFEEPLLETSMSVVVDERGEVISAVQLGLGPKHASVAGKPLRHDILASCIRIAKKRRLQLEEAMKC